MPAGDGDRDPSRVSHPGFGDDAPENLCHHSQEGPLIGYLFT